jgi:CRP-like cAMP-binding protein
MARSAVHAFSGFDDQELQQCLRRSSVIACSAGDRLVKKGGSSNNLFVVLAGSLEVREADALINTLNPGNVFGETAFLLGVPRQRDVIAVTDDLRVLALSDTAIRKLMTDQPASAAKLLLNLSKMLCDRLITTTDRVTA